MGASGTIGDPTSNAQTLGLNSLGDDGRSVGVVFTYQASTGEYYNSTYGYFNQLIYNSPSSLDDVTNLSLFGTNSLSMATADASDPYDMMQADPSGYLGSATVVTQPDFAGAAPAQATPDSIAATADSFIGQAWNMDGCWVLASTIAADAGTSLPVQSTLIGLPGEPNGEWIVAFNGPAGQTGNGQSMVKAGEMIVIGTLGDGGHITTCVAGSGATATLVDNVTYVNSSGQIQNLANDGSSDDVTIATPHPASQEWEGVFASSVVIYEQDTPAVAASLSYDSLGLGASQSLGSLFTTTDPASKAITEWHVYDTATSDALTLNGTDYGDHSAASALTTASIGSVSLLAGSTAATDTLKVRAYNGNYWGDWAPLNVAVGMPITGPPALGTQTPNQTWAEGGTVSLALPANTFADPQGESLTYTATQTDGQGLPTWLSLNSATATFSGTAPTSAQSLSIRVTATDTGGLSASENFTATVQLTPGVPAPGNSGISVTNQTPNQTWVDGQNVTLVLPSDTFTDELGLNMTFAAYEVSGPNVTSWLHFDASTDELYGTVPARQHGTVGLAVIATDSRNMTAMDLFSVTFAAGSAHVSSVVTTGVPDTDPTVAPTTMSGLIALQS